MGERQRYVGRGWAATVVFVAGASIVLGGCGDDASDGPRAQNGAATERATTTAQGALRLALSDSTVAQLVTALCDDAAAGRTSDALLELATDIPATSSPELAQALGALATGAAVLCPNDESAVLTLVDDVYAAIGGQFDTATAPDAVQETIPPER